MLRVYSSHGHTQHAAGWLAAAQVGNGAIRTTPEAPSSTYLRLSSASWRLTRQEAEIRKTRSGNRDLIIAHRFARWWKRAFLRESHSLRQAQCRRLCDIRRVWTNRGGNLSERLFRTARRQWPRFTTRYLALRLGCGTTSSWYKRLNVIPRW